MMAQAMMAANEAIHSTFINRALLDPLWLLGSCDSPFAFGFCWAYGIRDPDASPWLTERKRVTMRRRGARDDIRAALT